MRSGMILGEFRSPPPPCQTFNRRPGPPEPAVFSLLQGTGLDTLGPPMDRDFANAIIDFAAFGYERFAPISAVRAVAAWEPAFAQQSSTR